ncbi:hypothetical protein GW17_00053730, partial [Ensete ventricosum]
ENDRVNNGPIQLTEAYARSVTMSTSKVETCPRHLGSQVGGHISIRGGGIWTAHTSPIVADAPSMSHGTLAPYLCVD